MSPNTYKERMQLWVREVLGELGGEGKTLEVAKHLWLHHEEDLKGAGDAFYSWQYDMRWAADALRKQGKLGLCQDASRSIWVLKS